jgi:hypothetical protein
MIIDAKTAFKTSGGSEDLATSTTTEVLSDYIDFKAAGFFDGGHYGTVSFWIKSTDAAVGASFAFEVRDCATYNGTYVKKTSQTVALASCTANKLVCKHTMPKDLKQFVKVACVPAASMTGALTMNAARCSS